MASRTETPQVQSEPTPPFPAQKLPKPGLEADMKTRPKYEAPRDKAANKLDGRVALITGGMGQPPEKVKTFGKKTALGRPAQPEELAPAYVFLASDADSSFITGEILAVMGGGTAPG